MYSLADKVGQLLAKLGIFYWTTGGTTLGEGVGQLLTEFRIVYWTTGGTTLGEGVSQLLTTFQDSLLDHRVDYSRGGGWTILSKVWDGSHAPHPHP